MPPFRKAFVIKVKRVPNGAEGVTATGRASRFVTLKPVLRVCAAQDSDFFEVSSAMTDSEAAISKKAGTVWSVSPIRKTAAARRARL
jgi:hypothetical protein